jgi:hypothetical protein
MKTTDRQKYYNQLPPTGEYNQAQNNYLAQYQYKGNIIDADMYQYQQQIEEDLDLREQRQFKQREYQVQQQYQQQEDYQFQQDRQPQQYQLRDYKSQQGQQKYHQEDYRTQHDEQSFQPDEYAFEQDEQQLESYDGQVDQDQQPYQPQQDEEVEPAHEYYFQYKKIHNTGYWGDVRRRRGTWLVTLGFISICMSIVMVSVFWRWWWGPEVNVPCRVVGITLLICGVFLIIGGLISNFFMYRNNDSKHFLGSPPRWSSWLLLVGLVSIVIAADFITFYYSYWHNRFVNTPFIALSIVLFFFGTIFVVVGLRHNVRVMQRIKLARQVASKIENLNQQTDSN